MKNNFFSFMKHKLTLLLTILLIVFICYHPSLKNQFTNWDDNVHLTHLLSVRSLSFANLKNIFTESVFEVYIPLTTLSFAVEYYFFKLISNS